MDKGNRVRPWRGWRGTGRRGIKGKGEGELETFIYINKYIYIIVNSIIDVSSFILFQNKNKNR